MAKNLRIIFYIFFYVVISLFWQNSIYAITPLSNQAVFEQYVQYLKTGIKPLYQKGFDVNITQAKSLFAYFDTNIPDANKDLIEANNRLITTLSSFISPNKQFSFAAIEESKKAFQNLSSTLQKLPLITTDQEIIQHGLKFSALMFTIVLNEKYFQSSWLDKIRKYKWYLAAAVAVPAIAYGLKTWYEKEKAPQTKPPSVTKPGEGKALEELGEEEPKKNELQPFVVNLMPKGGKDLTEFIITTKSGMGTFIVPREVIEQSEYFKTRFLGQFKEAYKNEPLELDEFFEKTGQEKPSAESLKQIFGLLGYLADFRKIQKITESYKKSLKSKKGGLEEEAEEALPIKEEDIDIVAGDIADVLADIDICVQKLTAGKVEIPANITNEIGRIKGIIKGPSMPADVYKAELKKAVILAEEIEELMDQKSIIGEPQQEKVKRTEDQVIQQIADQIADMGQGQKTFYTFQNMKKIMMSIERLSISDVLLKGLVEFILNSKGKQFAKELYITLPDDCVQSKRIIKKRYEKYNEDIDTSIADIIRAQKRETNPFNASLYLSNENICNLEGIASCRYKDTILTIYLTDNPIIEIKPKAFDGFKHVTELYLNKNKSDKGVFKSYRGPLKIYDNAFEGLGSSFAGVEIHLEYNDIALLDARAFNDCVLKDLYLNNSRIKKLPAFFLKGHDYRHIRHTTFSFISTTIDEIEQDAFNGLFQPHRLSFEAANIKKIHPFAFRSLILSYALGDNLSFKNATINKLSKDSFNGSTNVKPNFEGCRFKEIEPFAFRGLHTGVLSFATGQIEEILPDTFNGMNLKHLDLSACQIKKIHPGAFRGLNMLDTLILPNNRIETLENDTFEGLNSLTSLNISNNMLKTIKPHTFRGLPQLQRLDISKKVTPVYKAESPLYKKGPLTPQEIDTLLEPQEIDLTKSQEKLSQEKTVVYEKDEQGKDAFSELPQGCAIDKEISIR